MPIDRLVKAIIAEGLVPPIIIKFPSITAGGGFIGPASESNSSKHGFFDDIVNDVKIVIPNSEVVKVNRSEKAALFRGAAGAVGTLSITTLMEL